MKNILVTLLLLLSATAWSDESAHDYEQGLRAYNQKEYQSALIHLKNSLQKDPNNLPSRILLGTIHIDQSNGDAAEKELRLALQLGGDQRLIVPLLMQALNYQQKYQQVLEDYPIEKYPTVIHGKMHYQRGLAHLESNNLDKATDAFQHSLLLGNQQSASHAGLAMTALQKRNFTLAKDEAIKAISIDPDNARAWHALGSISFAENQPSAAIENYRKALQLDKDYFSAKLSLATLYLDQKQHSRAIEIFSDLREKSTANPQVSFLYSLALKAAGETKKAQIELSHATDILETVAQAEFNNRPSLNFLAGLIYYENRQYEKAYLRLEQYLVSQPRNMRAQLLRASTLIGMDKAYEAIKVLKKSLLYAANDPHVHSLLGEAYFKAKQYSLAQEHLNRSLELNSNNIRGQTISGLTKLAIGQGSGAVEDLEKAATNLTDNSSIMPTLITLQLGTGNISRARELAENALSEAPGNTTIHNLLAGSYAAEKNYDRALTIYQQITETDPDFLLARLNIAKMEYALGNHDRAIIQVDQLENQYPRNTIVLYEKAKLLLTTGEIASAIKLLKKIHELDSSLIQPALDLVGLYLKTGEHWPALKLAKKLNLRFADNHNVQMALVSALLANRSKDKAKILLQQMTRKADYNMPALDKIADQQLDALFFDDARWTLQKLLDADADNYSALTRLAILQITTGRMESASQISKNLLEKFPDRAQTYLIAADIAGYEKKFDEVITHYQQAQKIKPMASTAVQIFRARHSLKQRDLALKELTAWTEKHPQDSLSHNVLGDYYLLKQDLEQAEKYYLKVLKLSPRHALVMNNLAGIYLETQPGKALEYVLKAYEIAPENTLILDRLGWILSQSGQHEDALRYLRNAVSRNSQSPQIHYHLGATLEAMQKPDEALISYQMALKLGSGKFQEEIKQKIRLLELSR